MKKNVFLLCMLMHAFLASAHNTTIETPSYKVSLSPKGTITNYILKTTGGNDSIQFRQDEYAGFAFEGVSLQPSQKQGNVYTATKDGIAYSLAYTDNHGILMVEAMIKNQTDQPFIPEKGVKLILGLNTCMEKYPDWNNQYFPTMIRCERTHMTSYFSTPSGKVLVVVSPDPIASWNNEYQYFPQVMNIQNHQVKQGAHRIYTSSFDLLHCLPLPVRHPQNLYALSPGQEKKARFFICPTDHKNDIEQLFHRFSGAPTITADLYTLAEGETFTGELIESDLKLLEIRTPRHEVDSIHLSPLKNNTYQWSYTPFSGIGEYTVTAMNRSGKISEMKLFVRPDFKFYLSHARKEGLRNKPTKHHGAECFYPFFSYFLSRKYVPNEAEDVRAEAVFDSIFPTLYDDKKGEMRRGKWRIQDAACMAGVLTDRYQVTKNSTDIKYASALVDHLMTCQDEKGGYCRLGTKVHYTSVIYIAKSIMEVMNEEKKLAESSKEWAETYQRHLASVTKAVDDLARRGDDVETEGQMTFEDGMISCSATQLALAALKTNDVKRRDLYLKQAIALNQKHWCLTQSLIPDSRMNGATLRFWEYQYTINFMKCAMNSPCGWSAWKLYGSWYLYLLTGDYTYMREVVNGLGSDMQLLDASTGELRFSFVADPYIDGYQFTETPKGSRKPVLNRVVVGEDYMSQISNWHYADYSAWRKNLFGIDNFAHEIFKCMCEIFMENAYIIETEAGVLKGLNCSLIKDPSNPEKYVVRLKDAQIKNLHINLKKSYQLEIDGKSYNASGMRWLIGYPDDLSKF